MKKMVQWIFRLDIVLLHRRQIFLVSPRIFYLLTGPAQPLLPAVCVLNHRDIERRRQARRKIYMNPSAVVQLVISS